MFNFEPLTIATATSLFYPKENAIVKCQTPNGEDGKCVRISDCLAGG